MGSPTLGSYPSLDPIDEPGKVIFATVEELVASRRCGTDHNPAEALRFRCVHSIDRASCRAEALVARRQGQRDRGGVTHGESCGHDGYIFDRRAVDVDCAVCRRTRTNEQA